MSIKKIEKNRKNNEIENWIINVRAECEFKCKFKLYAKFDRLSLKVKYSDMNKTNLFSSWHVGYLKKNLIVFWQLISMGLA